MYDIRSKKSYDINQDMTYDRLAVEKRVRETFGLNLADMSNIQLNSLADFIEKKDDEYTKTIRKQLSPKTTVSAINAYYVAYQKQVRSLKKEAKARVDSQREKWEEQKMDPDLLTRSLAAFSSKVNFETDEQLKQPKAVLMTKLQGYQTKFNLGKIARLKREIVYQKKVIFSDPNYQTRDNYVPRKKLDKDDPNYNHKIRFENPDDKTVTSKGEQTVTIVDSNDDLPKEKTHSLMSLFKRE